MIPYNNDTYPRKEQKVSLVVTWTPDETELQHNKDG